MGLGVYLSDLCVRNCVCVCVSDCSRVCERVDNMSVGLCACV